LDAAGTPKFNMVGGMSNRGGTHQPEILSEIPPLGRFFTLALRPGAKPEAARAKVARLPAPEGGVVGLGAPLLPEGRVAGLRAFPAMASQGLSVPSTQGALWVFLGASDAGALLREARSLLARLEPCFTLDEEVFAFKYAEGRDLSGYKDGTENPKGAAARAAALVRGLGAGLDGSSFVAAQRWVHDLTGLEGLRPAQRDNVVGRTRDGDVELEHAPASAHVKRSAQESFSPEAFMVRRSMPYGGVKEHGLYFVAYGHSLDAFEKVLRRMTGQDDGVVDALFSFTRPVSGGYYWCPPVREGRLDLRAL
jgi:putative iron-dependent peroxidase